MPHRSVEGEPRSVVVGGDGSQGSGGVTGTVVTATVATVPAVPALVMRGQGDGREILERVIADTAAYGESDKTMDMEGRVMSVTINPIGAAAHGSEKESEE